MQTASDARDDMDDSAHAPVMRTARPARWSALLPLVLGLVLLGWLAVAWRVVVPH